MQHPAYDFLLMLSGGDPGTLHAISTSYYNEGKYGPFTTRYLTAADAVVWASEENAKSRCVFYTLQASDGKGRSNKHITHARAVAVDIDDPLRSYPVPVPVTPSARVRTARGEHLIWCIEPTTNWAEVKHTHQTLITEIGSDGACKDPARLLRLPGFYHCKNHDSPVLCELTHIDPSRRYSLEQITDSFVGRGPDVPAQRLYHYHTRVLTKLDPLSDEAQQGNRNNLVYSTAWLGKDLVREGWLSEEQLYADIIVRAVHLPGDEPFTEAEAAAAVRSALSSEVTSDAHTNAIEVATAPPANPDSGEANRVLDGIDLPQLTQRVIDDLGGAGKVIIDGGMVWRYDPRGVWVALTEKNLKTQIQSYTGYLVFDGKSGTTKRITIKPKMRDEALNFLMHREDLQHDGFFAGAPRGIQFADVWLSLAEDGAPIAEAPSPEHRCRTYSDVSITVPSTCYRWEEFLNSVWPDESIQAIVQEAVGTALLGDATRFQQALLFVGDGANGKGVFSTILSDIVFPKDTTSSINPENWGNEKNIMGLRDSLLNIVGELSMKFRTDDSIIKSVIAGDSVEGRHPYERGVSFRPRCLHMFSCNHLPRTYDSSHGHWRRFIVIPCEQRFDGSTAPRTIVESMRDEAAAIIRWALAGAQRVIRQKHYTISKRASELKAEWQTDADTVSAFLAACQDTAAGDAKKVTPAEAYSTYLMWCESAGRRSISATRFGRRLTQLGIGRGRNASARWYEMALLPAPGWNLTGI